MSENGKPAVDPATIPKEFVGGTIAPQYTYTEIANLKRVKVRTVMAWVRKGMIPSPIYTGATARFSEEMVADIMCGIRPAGTYTRAKSVRSKIGAKGGNPNVMPKRPPKKIAAKKPAAKKPKSKRRMNK